MEFIQGKLSSVFRPMDFHGQRVAEQLLIRAVVLFAALGFVVGYATGSFRHMVEINGVGLAIVSLLVLPPWPWYSKHSLTWLPDLNPSGTAQQ